MTKERLINILKYSVILGAILGVLAVVPIIRIASFLIISTCVSILIFLYMKKKNQINDLTTKGGAIIGALIGFICLVGFLITFLPLNAILGALPIKTIADNYALTKDLILIWWLWLIMGGLIVAIFNSFSLLSFFYIKETYFMIKEEKETKPDFTPRGRK